MPFVALVGLHKRIKIKRAPYSMKYKIEFPIPHLSSGDRFMIFVAGGWGFPSSFLREIQQFRKVSHDLLSLCARLILSFGQSSTLLLSLKQAWEIVRSRSSSKPAVLVWSNLLRSVWFARRRSPPYEKMKKKTTTCS
eukprot:TRINITY_DN5422_c0_g1_i4.p1 TRINITY_DN5422_c0_g1~~TRINITY_DN5422_c0_g1_i4.p1  ORF type:complete len:137 (-),score=19.87 TRINITY_DN5422_c0_g1_i4:593-1003(-)